MHYYFSGIYLKNKNGIYNKGIKLITFGSRFVTLNLTGCDLLRVSYKFHIKFDTLSTIAIIY